ncbi:Afadin and alpha-actinin-binding-domain-containing protein [Phlyctochytrium arcticum]|nr:Afadin and alpha-actinin-binding-domain-containing protein [Phlyctochytrium arcticum]
MDDRDAEDGYNQVSTPSSGPSAQETLKKSVDYVNHELANAGFPIALDFSGFSGATSDASKILDCVCTLLQQRQKDVAFREDLQYRFRRTAGEVDELTTTVARLRARLEQCDRELVMINGKLDSAQKALKKETEKGTAAREELRACKANLQFSKTQYNHDLRKRELEHQRLKDRMQKIVIEKTASLKVGMKLANPLPKTTSAVIRKKAGRAVEGEEMYNVVMKSFEDREQELIAENQSLRETLYSLYSELRSRFESQIKPTRDELKIEDRQPSEMPPNERAQFQLPFNLVQHSVEAKIKDSLSQLEDEWHSLNEALEEQQAIQPTEDLSGIKEQLDLAIKNCENYKRIIEEQNKIMALSNIDTQSPVKQHKAADLDEAMRQLQRDREEMQAKAEKLESDRQKFTEAAIKLGLERAALQRERDMLEERDRAETAERLQDLSRTPAWLKDRLAKGGQSLRKSPSTPTLRGARPNDHTRSPLTPTTHGETSETSSPGLWANRLVSSTTNHSPLGNINRSSSPQQQSPNTFMRSHEIVAETDTFVQTPQTNTSRSHLMSQSTPTADRSPLTSLGSNSAHTTPMSATSLSSLGSIKSAMKKQASFGSLGSVNRSVRIALQRENALRSVRPGEGDSKENVGDGAGAQDTTTGISFSKSFMATSTPNVVIKPGMQGTQQSRIGNPS